MGMTTAMPVKPPVKSDGYYLLAPDGDPIVVPRGLYEAVRRLLLTTRENGGARGLAEIVIQIKTGGIAGVKATEETIYK